MIYSGDLWTLLSYWVIGMVLFKIMRYVERHTGAGPTPIKVIEPPTSSDLRGLKPEDHAWLDAWTYPMMWRIYEEVAREPKPVPAQRALTSTPTWPIRLTKHAMITACEEAGVEVSPTLPMAAVRRIYEREIGVNASMERLDRQMATAVLSDFTDLRKRAEDFGHLEPVHTMDGGIEMFICMHCGRNDIHAHSYERGTANAGPL